MWVRKGELVALLLVWAGAAESSVERRAQEARRPVRESEDQRDGSRGAEERPTHG